jgi:mono/diheme cytochrome c family protein
MAFWRFAAKALLIGSMAVGAEAAQDIQADEAARLKRGRDALRAMDCARCHGRDYDGWAAASLIAAVRDGSRIRFESIVLDGVPGRGMPGYRSQPLVVRELDAMYSYLSARSRGGISDGPP